MRENICTFFNLINALIFSVLVAFNSFSNLFFMGVVLSNLLIGITQEIRSKRALDKLSLLNAPYANVVREGLIKKIRCDEIVLDDIIQLELGQQVPADCIIQTGAIEADESHITGESIPCLKEKGASLLSGSAVLSGQCRARVDKIGEDCYAAKLTGEAKRYKKHTSELMRSLQLIIRFTALFVLPLGVLMFFRSYYLDHALKHAVEQSAAAMLGMIPSGLMLLTSVSLSVGVIALSRKKVMAQHPHSIETLSRVNMLCLDKTGTLTSGNLYVKALICEESRHQEETEKLLGVFLSAMLPNNPTSKALHAYAALHEACEAPIDIMPFSSARRYSAACFSGYTLFLGAVECLCPLSQYLQEQSRLALNDGCRVLLFAKAPKSNGVLPPDKCKLTPLCLIILKDEIRKEAKDTLLFFKEQGVKIKIISGDNPKTASFIAMELGLQDGEKYIDVSTLKDDEIKRSALLYTVFGRVGPHEKRMLINALKKAGYIVAMTGDGVNDLLALRDAHCSIALYNGSDAARQISQLVLLTNDFSALPAAVMEGRRVVNNVSRTASLFLVKTIYSFLLTAGSILIGLGYPFMPAHLTLISMATVGIPSFFLSLQPNKARIKGKLLRRILSNAAPGGIVIFLYALIAGIIGPVINLSYQDITTLCLYLTGTAGLMVLLRVCLPLENYRGLLFFACAIYFFVVSYILKDILRLALPPHWLMLLMYLIMALACYPLLNLFARLGRRIIIKLVK